MGDVVNLRQARKARARVAKEAAAAEKRAKFGVPKALRDKRAAEDALERNRLEALKRDRPEDDG
jgi:hypothetical protein